MRPDTSDAEAPAPGDRIVVRGGQFAAQRGTLVRRNGNRAGVVLHPPSSVVVRTLDGRLCSVRPDELIELTMVNPMAEYVVKDAE